MPSIGRIPAKHDAVAALAASGSPLSRRAACALALTAAASTLGGKYLQGCTLYVTVEPCIMCAGATGWAQVGRVVWGADDPKKGYRRYSETVFHPKTTVVRGVLGEECEELMTSFFAGLRN